MYQTLLDWDRSIFYLINTLPHGAVPDTLVGFLSAAGTFGFVWFVIAVLLFILEVYRDRWFFPTLILTSGISLSIELILKEVFARSRPDVGMGAVILTYGVNNSYSFPSGHAMIAFAMAALLSSAVRKHAAAFYLLAASIALSRVYLGRHYPSDILAGACLGWIIGWTAGRIHVSLANRRK